MRSFQFLNRPGAISARNIFSSAALAFGILSQITGLQAAATYSSVFSFGGENGSNPNGKLLADASGNFFGTTYNGGTYGRGTVYQLTPGANGYTETVLYVFTGHADGAHPTAGLVMNSNGSLFGTASTSFGLADGVVFELSLANGTYSYHVIHAFGGAPDGSYPNCDLVFGPKGALYGTTVSGGAAGKGTVFELTPPAAQGDSWTESLIYSLTGAVDGSFPYAGVVFDASGNLYGTAASGGTANAGAVFMLAPPVKGTTWTETTLYDFMGTTDGANPFSELLVGSKGALYGTTFIGGGGFGVVFELTPPTTMGNPYVQTVLLTFNGNDGANPSAALIQDASGNLYGTAGGAVAGNNGNVFKLQYSSGTFTEHVLYSFTATPDGMTPLSGLIPNKAGALFGSAFTVALAGRAAFSKSNKRFNRDVLRSVTPGIVINRSAFKTIQLRWPCPFHVLWCNLQESQFEDANT